MKRVLATLLLATLVFATARGRASESPAQQPATTNTGADVRFESVDVWIDTKGTPLAAYQVEFVADAQRVKLVGIEGGEHGAFREPPYYDPAALNRNRVIVAAFNTGSDLPAGRTRVARLHVQIEGAGQPAWEAKLVVAASPAGESIPAEVSLSEGASQ